MTAATDVCGMNFLHVLAFELAIILSSFIHQGLGLIQTIGSRPLTKRRLVQPLFGMIFLIMPHYRIFSLMERSVAK